MLPGKLAKPPGKMTKKPHGIQYGFFFFGTMGDSNKNWLFTESSG